MTLKIMLAFLSGLCVFSGIPLAFVSYLSFLGFFIINLEGYPQMWDMLSLAVDLTGRLDDDE